MLKSKKVIFVGVILSLVLMSGYLFGCNNAVNEVSIASEDELENTISVSGEGIVKITPDVAFINIGVETENKDSKKAQSENAKKMDAIVKKLKSENIKNEDIKTIEYNINTSRVYNKEKNSYDIVGYIVRNVVEVTIKDIDNVGSILDSVSNEGSNYISNIRFGTLKYEEYYLEALKLAMESCKSKANAIAGTFGVKLDKPYKVIENSYSSYPVRYDLGEFKSMADESSMTPISQGELQIKATINSIYNY